MPSSVSPIQSIDKLFRPNGKVFYGWWIVAIAALIQFIGGVLWMQSYGLYTVVLHEEFSWSMTVLSGAFALTRVESGLLGPLQGWLVDRYGPRIILTVGLAMFGIGFLLLSQTDSLLSYYLIVFVISVGVSLGGFHTLMVSIVNWFQKHRTKAVAWSQMGYSVGGLCVPVVAWGMEWDDWRTVAMISGGMIVLLGIPAVQWIRHRPEEKGEQVDGIVQKEEEQTKIQGCWIFFHLARCSQNSCLLVDLNWSRHSAALSFIGDRSHGPSFDKGGGFGLNGSKPDLLPSEHFSIDRLGDRWGLG